MAINSVSFMGRSTAQINRLKNLNTLMTDLQRQLATQKKAENYAGLGTNATTVQRVRADASRLDGYLNNIDSLTTRIESMSDAMDRIATQGRTLIESITSQTRQGEVEIDSIKTIAKNALDFVQELVNHTYDGRYLFAGSDNANKPYIDDLGLNTSFQNDVADWLDGTISTNDIINNTEGMTAQDLGFSPTISSGGAVRTQIDDGLEIDYTVRGDIDGFQDVIRALGFAANLEYPDPATDTPTDGEFHEVLTKIMNIARRGVEQIDEANLQLNSKMTLVQSVQEAHGQDKAQMQLLTDNIENVDTTEVVARIQALQTQLSASYQVTNLVSQLSLVNFLG